MEYYKQEEDPLVLLKEWVDIYFPDNTEQRTLKINAYALKHYFQYYPGGIYLTKEEFAELMEKLGFESHYEYRDYRFYIPHRRMKNLDAERFRYGFKTSVWYYHHADEDEKEKVKQWIKENLEPVKTHNDVLGDLVYLYKEFCNIDKQTKIEPGFMRGALLELGYSETLGYGDALNLGNFKMNVSKKSINKLYENLRKNRRNYNEYLFQKHDC